MQVQAQTRVLAMVAMVAGLCVIQVLMQVQVQVHVRPLLVVAGRVAGLCAMQVQVQVGSRLHLTGGIYRPRRYRVQVRAQLPHCPCSGHQYVA